MRDLMAHSARRTQVRAKAVCTRWYLLVTLWCKFQHNNNDRSSNPGLQDSHLQSLRLTMRTCPVRPASRRPPPSHTLPSCHRRSHSV